MFRTDFLSIIRGLITVFTAIYIFVKFVKAQQAKQTYEFKNTEKKIAQNQRRNIVQQNVQKITANYLTYINCCE